MISGAHIVVYSKNAEADRAFFRDILGFKSVDAGHGWLIFALHGGMYGDGEAVMTRALCWTPQFRPPNLWTWSAGENAEQTLQQAQQLA
jgi:catechol 2,3-dioxygenase-like lactoylglutathione lyase family enzyme